MTVDLNFCEWPLRHVAGEGKLAPRAGWQEDLEALVQTVQMRVLSGQIALQSLRSGMSSAGRRGRGRQQLQRWRRRLQHQAGQQRACGDLIVAPGSEERSAHSRAASSSRREESRAAAV